MKNILTFVFCVFCLFTSSAVSQGSMTVAGVTFDNTVKVGGSALVLNGAGVRTKQLFKIYAAGLYLTSNKTTTADVLSLGGAKRVKMVILRDLDSNSFASGFTTAFNNNNSSVERTRIFSSITQFNALFATVPVLKKGDVITLDWVPGKGLQCTRNDRAVGNDINDAAFYQALLKVWLGDRAVETALKTALLRGNPEGPR